ncbi:MAG: hypothetical protein NTX40_00980, partial [Planctomycetota bacterium]|nr:hypothetical protein [Planctomycetota bacterium]
MKSILLTILSSVSCALVALAEDASATAAPKPIAASTDLLSFMRLEGMNNLGEAAVEKKDRAVEVKGALVTPFPLGSSQSQASAQVRLYIPKRDGTPYHGSACLGFYGKNRNLRLFAFVCFNLPGMAPGQCEVGFLARASKQIPLAFEAWHTMKLETADGLARMKIWADGTAEPDWMIDASVESSLEDIDGAGVRTCGQPVLFESFSASGTQYKEAILTVGSEGEGIVGKLRNDGSLRDLKVRYADGWQTVEFRQDQFRGPGFGRSIRLERDPCETISFSGKNDDVRYRLAYAIADRQLQVTATVINSGKKPFAPERLPLVLGIDSFMDSYPRWNSLCFPTLIRREPSHLWGYMMTPHGRIFGIASPDPVGSYTCKYLRQMYAHHIYTISLDLLQKPPVPGHHPTYAPLAPSKQRTWTVNLIPVETLDAVKSKLAASARAPMLDLYRYSLEPGQPAEMSVFSFSPVTAIVVTPAGTEVPCPVGKKEGNLHQATFPDTAEYGDYRVRI